MTDESSKPAKKPATVTPVKAVRVVKGGGRLNSGGSWPNSGRPPDAIRALAREGLMKAVPNLVRLAAPESSTSGPTVKDADQINAASVLARIGLPSQMEVGENPDAPMLTDAQRKAKLKALLG